MAVLQLVFPIILQNLSTSMVMRSNSVDIIVLEDEVVVCIYM